MENLKSKIIPENIKVNIDEILETQLFNVNRYYAEFNRNISNLMQKELYNRPEVFYKRLVDRWNWHNKYYEDLLEPAYAKLIRDCDKELSPNEIDDLIDVYMTCCKVDEATLIMSGSIKKFLEYWCTNICVNDENLSKNEADFMLLTPPIETFFARYQIDHLYYIYISKFDNSKSFEYREYLKQKYHANDEVIFKNRFAKRFDNYFELSEKELLEEIKKYTIPESYKINHYYFTLEHSERKSIRDIIIYDNLYEKLIGYGLVGISGFLVRRKILEYLNNSKILLNNGYIYEYDNDIIINALKKLKEKRKNEMDKNVKVYRQRGDTCAIACMMMALEYYNIMEKANWYDEKRFYKIYGSRYIEGTPFAALAYHFSKKGLNTSLYHSDINIFNNNSKNLEDNIFNMAMKEYNQYLERAIKVGANVINGTEINSEVIMKNLISGNIIIAAGEISGIYHAILISGYEDDKFIVCDPLYKNKRIITKEELDNFMNTSIGKWFISVNDNKKEKEDLMNNLHKFDEQAKEFLEEKKVGTLTYERK